MELFVAAGHQLVAHRIIRPLNAIRKHDQEIRTCGIYVWFIQCPVEKGRTRTEVLQPRGVKPSRSPGAHAL